MPRRREHAIMCKSILPSDHRTRDAVPEAIHVLRPRLENVGVRHLAIFGSVARGDDVTDSDVDIALDIDPEEKTGLFQIAGLVELLEAALGRSVDLAVRRALRAGHHGEILADLYEVF